MNIRSKVLVVDDIGENHFAVESVIEHLDIEIFHAHSGTDALRLVMQHQFAVVLMDIQMPGIDGIETTQLIHGRKSCAQVPIVVLTAFENDSDKLSLAYEAGAVDYITKPINSTALTNKVRQFVTLELQIKKAEEARLEQLETSARLHSLINSAGEGIIGINTEGLITFANPKAAEIIGVEQFRMAGHSIDGVLFTKGVSSSNHNQSTLYTCLSTLSSGHCDDDQWHKPDGERFDVEYNCDPISNALGEATGMVVMFQDITQRKVIEEKLRYLATYDPLTQLANRAYFHDSLDKAIARSKRSQVALGVLIIDLDHFKYINDHYGHDGGDLLLQIVSSRIQSFIRQGDVVARLGGDEFAAILYDIPDINAIVPITQKIIDGIAAEIDLSVAKVNVSCSIGIALYDDFSSGMKEVIKQADTALYEAKDSGRNHFQVFAPDMRKERDERQRIQLMLQRAISDNELSIVYQPKVSLVSRSIAGCEALLRWHPKEKGVDSNGIGPAVFIPIAEESGQIVEIGLWAIEQACQQIQSWRKQGFQSLCVSVNVSIQQLKSGGFFEQIKEMVDRYSINPPTLELEITETSAITNQDMVILELEKIHAMGIKISIDDFGTGNASLDYLRKLPLDILKIDRSFIKDIGVDDQDEELIQVILAVSNTMKLVTVAEGVESLEQLFFLSQRKCDLIQGFFFSKPLSVSEMEVLLEKDQNHLCFSGAFEQLDRHKQMENLKTNEKNDGNNEKQIGDKKMGENENRILKGAVHGFLGPNEKNNPQRFDSH